MSSLTFLRGQRKHFPAFFQCFVVPVSVMKGQGSFSTKSTLLQVTSFVLPQNDECGSFPCFYSLVFHLSKQLFSKLNSYYWNYVPSSHVYFLQWLTYYISFSFGITISFLNFNFLVSLDPFINMLNHSPY